jgi:hypothetical protein
MSFDGDDEEKQRKYREALLRAYHQIFEEHPAGRMVLLDLLREGGVLAINFVAGDAHHTAWNDGRRSLALTVLERLRWSEGQMLQLAQMNQDEAAWNPIAPDAGTDQIDPQSGDF